MNLTPRQLKWGGIGIGAVVLLIMIAATLSSWKSEGVHLETTLSKQYLMDQNEYSNYGAGLVEQLGVSDEKKAAVIEIISAYVSGRKSEGSGSLMTAVKEAVPDLTVTGVYDKIVNYIQAGRERFKGRQDNLLSQIQTYDNFLNEGLVRPWILKNVLGFPRDTLTAQIGSEKKSGQPALEQLRVIVTTSDARKAFETGSDKPVINRKPKDGK